jgi:Leucine-rich repeat (LRR) protein
MSRVLFNGEKGTVRYRGKLLHKVDNSKIKADEDWLGVEWDLAQKGKHNGTVEGVEYFKCEKQGNAGSLILAKKAELGQEILEALIRRYFKDHEVNEILKHKHDIINFLKDKWQKEKEKLQAQAIDSNAGWNKKKAAVEAKPKEASQKAEPETTASEKQSEAPAEETMFEEDPEEEQTGQKGEKQSRGDVVEQLYNKIKSRDCYTTEKVKVEYDEDAYINTYKNRFKRIEFKGFDKIWERIYNLDKLIEICLSSLRIQDFGALGGLGNIVPNVRHLTLENNLLHNWSQVLVLGTELPRLESLSVSYNSLKCEAAGYVGSELDTWNADSAKKQLEQPAAAFPRLKKLIAIATGLTFEAVDKVAPFMPVLEELVLCQNSCHDFEHLDASKLSRLQSLNLENNKITDSCSTGLLGKLERLRDLALNQNEVSRFPNPEQFKELENLNLSHNIIADGRVLSDLRNCPKLKSLKINYNPIEQGLNKKDISRRAVAEISSLTRINGMDLGRYERKDCEYYFLRWVFHEYFTVFGLHQLSYKFADFEVWAREHYPAVFDLIKKYENPYPEVDVKAVEEDREQVLAQAPVQQARYTKLLFSTPIGPLGGKPPLSKNFPRTTDFLYIRNWVSQTFKLPNKEAIVIKFKNGHNQVYENIDDMTKSIDYYDIKDNADVIVEEK